MKKFLILSHCIIIMSICALAGIALLDKENALGWVLLGPAAWTFIFVVLLFEFYSNIIKGKVMSKYRFEELKKTNMYYKHLFGNYYMFRKYGNKKRHPVLYHLILIEKIKVR